MVRLRIDIEAIAGDPNAMNILLKTETNRATEPEEASARRLLPALRNLLKTGFPDSDESRQPVADKSPSP